MTDRRIGIVMWLMVGIPVAIQPEGEIWRMLAWLSAYGVFGALYRFGRGTAPLVLESATVVTMVLTRCNGFEGTLLVLVAMQLGAYLSTRAGLAWIVAQTVLLGGSIALHWSLRPALMLTPPYFGFQVVAFATVVSMTHLAAATREIERLRITRDLHDALGHRLTALTLNLEAAQRRLASEQPGEARESVETAQSLARDLMTNVRDVIQAKRDDGELASGLERLIDSIPRPRVHLQVASQLSISDPSRRHVLLRAVQEIVTNAARHSDAENLWIVIDRDGSELRIRAHDDGRGGRGDTPGFGLRSMRGRVEGTGGTLTLGSMDGRGFQVVATIPVGES
ncbi:MAG TPA: sensor histidine kinase [Thermoanaerobaculia bacterium]|nr:sensor histidine kinase [Thermoanaerobaculia bacterium]